MFYSTYIAEHIAMNSFTTQNINLFKLQNQSTPNCVVMKSSIRNEKLYSFSIVTNHVGTVTCSAEGRKFVAVFNATL